MEEPKRALILLAHGSSDPVWQKVFERHLIRLKSKFQDRKLALAFMEFSKPTLSSVCASLMQEGYAQADLLPVFLAEGGHVSRDIPLLVENARKTSGLRLECHPPLGSFLEFSDCLDAVVRRVMFESR